jgi:methyl-accepting chemotaxis protein
MKPLNIVNTALRTKLIIAIILILAFVVLSSVGFFYYYTDQELGETYAQKVFALPQFKTIIVRNSLYIYTLFALVATVGIAVIVILYTHRIVGPLIRMERLMGQMSEGNFEEVVRFRKGDAVHPLADALQDVAIRYKERRGIIRDLIHEMHRDSIEMQELVKKGDIKAAEDKRQNIEKKAEDISKLLSDIKL